MKKEYEEACVQAGMDKEATDKIRRLLDAEKKRLRRENRAMEKSGFRYFSVTNVAEGTEGDADYDIPDIRVKVEERAIRNVELAMLRKELERLPEEERRFLQICYGECNDSKVARRLNMSRQMVRYNKERLVKQLRKQMGVNDQGEINLARKRK